MKHKNGSNKNPALRGHRLSCISWFTNNSLFVSPPHPRNHGAPGLVHIWHAITLGDLRTSSSQVKG